MQVCTGVMLHGYGMVKQLCGELQVSKQDTLLLAFAFIVLLDSVSRMYTFYIAGDTPTLFCNIANVPDHFVQQGTSRSVSINIGMLVMLFSACCRTS